MLKIDVKECSKHCFIIYLSEMFYEKMIKQLILLTFFIFPIKLMLKIS